MHLSNVGTKMLSFIVIGKQVEILNWYVDDYLSLNVQELCKTK